VCVRVEIEIETETEIESEIESEMEIEIQREIKDLIFCVELTKLRGASGIISHRASDRRRRLDENRKNQVLNTGTGVTVRYWYWWPQTSDRLSLCRALARTSSRAVGDGEKKRERERASRPTLLGPITLPCLV
jgi:hypothetical protein